MPSPPLTPLAAATLHVAPPPERILEVESGDGEGALFLAREFPAARVRGVDRAPARVRAAQARVGLDPEGRIAFKQGRPKALPYPDDFFDLVVALDRQPPAAEVARVLRPGGRLILADSRRADAAGGIAGRLRRRQLRRRGIVPIVSGPAGDGSFCVFQLRAADPGPPAD